jgi:hypothetical protein
MGGGPDEIVDYHPNQYREDLRFTTQANNRLEWLRTNELLAEMLPPRARALPEPDGTYDATLLLGPLYHLLDRDDRVRALSRRPGSPAPVGSCSPPLSPASPARSSSPPGASSPAPGSSAPAC